MKVELFISTNKTKNHTLVCKEIYWPTVPTQGSKILLETTREDEDGLDNFVMEATVRDIIWQVDSSISIILDHVSNHDEISSLIVALCKDGFKVVFSDEPEND